MKYETLAWKICDFGLFGSIVELILKVWMMVLVKSIGSCGLLWGKWFWGLILEVVTHKFF